MKNGRIFLPWHFFALPFFCPTIFLPYHFLPYHFLPYHFFAPDPSESRSLLRYKKIANKKGRAIFGDRPPFRGGDRVVLLGDELFVECDDFATVTSDQSGEDLSGDCRREEDNRTVSAKGLYATSVE